MLCRIQMHPVVDYCYCEWNVITAIGNLQYTAEEPCCNYICRKWSYSMLFYQYMIHPLIQCYSWWWHFVIDYIEYQERFARVWKRMPTDKLAESNSGLRQLHRPQANLSDLLKSINITRKLMLVIFSICSMVLLKVLQELMH